MAWNPKEMRSSASPRQMHPVHKRCEIELAIIALLVAILIAASQGAAWAQPAVSSPPDHLELPTLDVTTKPLIGGPSNDPCVRVDAAGRKAGDAECAAQKLQDAAKAAQDQVNQGRDTANIPGVTSQDTRLGVANQAATKQRLGDNFGKSVLPQRPNMPSPAPTPFTRQN